jgi:integrase
LREALKEWRAGLLAAGLSPKRAGKALQVLSQVLASAVDVRYRPLILFAAYTGLRPCELVALRVGRVDLLRCTAQVVEAAVEVSRLEWGPVKTHEARTVRLPRSVAEEVAASLAGRPHHREALVFTAPMGGPLSRAAGTDPARTSGRPPGRNSRWVTRLCGGG